jgi:hypothetical protein
MRLAAKVEVVLFSMLALSLAGCGLAVRTQKPALPPEIMQRNVECKKKSENGETVIADCKCKAPVFAFNAKTGEQEIQCAGATK